MQPSKLAAAAKRADLTRIALVYLAALVVAVAVLQGVTGHPLWQLLLADTAATAVVFVFSVRYRNSSVYDAYWSVAPPVIALWFLTLPGSADPTRALIVVALVWVWGVRLTANWAWGWTGMDSEDWRYRQLAARSGRFWWPLSLLGVHLLPTFVVLTGCIPLYPALVVGGRAPGWLDAAALAIGALSVALEFRADQQLHRFRATRTSSRQVLSEGVWAWCRHPNYLGEIGFWISLFLFGWSAYGSIYPWSWSGPLIMLALFACVSIPLIERKLEADKPGYAAYRAGSRALLPLPGRRPR